LKKGQKKSKSAMAKLTTNFQTMSVLFPGNHFACRSDLIVEGSETRRKFMDSVISQLDSQYLQHLIQYQKVLNQRNALLIFRFESCFENDTLAIYNEQLDGAVNISSIKKEFISQFISLTSPRSGSQETVQVVYESHLFENNLLVLKQHFWH
jgi:DNA replication and repair protein RecF